MNMQKLSIAELSKTRKKFMPARMPWSSVRSTKVCRMSSLRHFSYGVPCIGFADCPGVRDLIEHRVNGFLLNERSDDAIAAALKELASDDLRKTLAEGAKASARSFLDLKNWRQSWLKMLDNAAAGLDRHGQQVLPGSSKFSTPPAEDWQEILAPYATYDSDNFDSMGRFGLLKRVAGRKA